MRRIASATKRVESELSLRNGGAVDLRHYPADIGQWAIIQGQSSEDEKKHHYAFTVISHDGTGGYAWGATSSRINDQESYRAIEVNQNKYVPDRTRVRIWFKGVDGDSGLPLFHFMWVPYLTPFAVSVTKDSGDDGDEDTTCTIGYSCSRYGTAGAIDTNVIPEKPRLEFVTYLPAEPQSHGIAVYEPPVDLESAPTFKLLEAVTEIMTSGVCP